MEIKFKNYAILYRFVDAIVHMNLTGSAKLGKYLSRILMPKPQKELIIHTLHGFKLKINPAKDKNLERKIYYSGTYEEGTLMLMREILSPGDIFVDVGANIGLMSILAAIRVGKNGKVISFEANPETKKLLDENIALNQLRNVKVFGVALGSTEGSGKIYSRWSKGRGSASLLIQDDNGDKSDSHDILIKRFDNVSEVQNDHIRLIKIDVEGYELEVVKGLGKFLTSAEAPILIMECSEVRKNLNSTTSDLYQFIRKSNDYRFFKLKLGKERRSKLVEITQEHQLPDHDNIFCFLPNHLGKLDKKLFAH